MNILIIGSGGREHAFVWKLKQSPRVGKIFVIPGNAGTAKDAENIAIPASDFNEIATFVLKNSVDLVISGPEQPLVDGIADYFQSRNDLKHIPFIGPSKFGAQLEGSKDFAKAFMQRHNIPTARYQSFTKETINQAFAFLQTLKPPYVLKADGLAAGKGVVILEDLQEAKNELEEMFSGKFGKAGNTVVIEEFLKGIELSVFVLTDGKDYVIFPEAKDYKRIGEADTGLNTGGMGAVSPVPFADKAFMDKVEQQIIKPTVEGIRDENIDYKGFIFFGLINVEENPMVIEYNVRMGDPETEVVFPRLENDLLELLLSTCNGSLNKQVIKTDSRHATTIMLVAGGYPGPYEKGKQVENLDKVKDSIVFHAGTSLKNGAVLTNGGRVMAVTSYGSSMKEALELSNKNASLIQYEGKNYRTDIGFDLR